jgi:hypothetical protein
LCNGAGHGGAKWGGVCAGEVESAECMYSAGVEGGARYGKRFFVFDSHTTYLVFVVGAQKYAVFVFFRIHISKYSQMVIFVLKILM